MSQFENISGHDKVTRKLPAKQQEDGFSIEASAPVLRARNASSRVSRLLKQASSHSERGLHDDAIKLIKQAMEIRPNDPRCCVQLASAYRAQNKISLAVGAMKMAAELDPGNSLIQEQLLQALVELERYDEAITIGKKVLKRLPKSLYARDVLGIAYLHKGKIDKALAVTNELIRLAPADPLHYFKKAVLLQQKGEVAMAMETFTKALEMDPEGEMADDAREAIAALDSYQLRQILTIAIEDTVFRAKLVLDPETASRERGFYLSSGGIMLLRQIDIDSLPQETRNVYYH